MTDLPFTFTIPFPDLIPTRVDHHTQRRLSDLQGQFFDQQAYQAMLAADDILVYEVYELRRPEINGELMMGISVVHPGKVGREFFMTKGHFHSIRDTSEVYYCQKGEGFMVMENSEGEAAVEALTPGRVLYVPPGWAHRSVCTSRQQDLVTFYVFPAHAGHDYRTIEKQGFRKLVVEGQSEIEIIENPRWHR